MTDTKLQIQEALRTPNGRINTSPNKILKTKTKTLYLSISYSNYRKPKTKRKFWKKSEEEKYLTYKNTGIRIIKTGMFVFIPPKTISITAFLISVNDTSRLLIAQNKKILDLSLALLSHLISILSLVQNTSKIQALLTTSTGISLV